MRCAFLTMEDLSAFVSDADLCVGAMAEAGWAVEFVPWRRHTDWNRYDAVYICTPWDYWDDVDAFLAQLECIEASNAVLVNDLELVRWNLDKRYLAELEGRGAPIVPSRWLIRFDAAALHAAFDEWRVSRIVTKPRFGGNAVDVFVLASDELAQRSGELADRYGTRPVIVQPFIGSIRNGGEHSLFYFSGDYSHAIRKLPAAGDFRTQEEHGAEILSADAPPALRETADRVMRLVQPVPAYARADFVQGDAGQWLLMELELIEPSLYFRTDEGSPARFANAFDSHVRARLRT